MPFDRPLIRARLVSLLRRTPVPPGAMRPALDAVERDDRLGLLTLFDRHGPIIKGRAWNELWIYVLGLPRAREILRQHAADMQAVTIDTTSLFAKGLLRQMEGQDHRTFRGAIVDGLRSARPAEDFTAFRADVSAGLSALPPYAPDGGDPLRQVLGRAVFNDLARAVLGFLPGTAAHARLAAAFDELGRNGLVWTIGVRQRRAYQAICDLLARTPPDGGLRAHLPADLAGDPDMIGNLIYMVEMGRYDLTAFLRWLLWFLASQPDAAQSIRTDGSGDRNAAAFVAEALRMEQSERLVRKVTRDFTAEGVLFPRGAKVRFCIWESHKLPAAHDDPLLFRPGRFLTDKPGPDRYAPFGMGHHQCPFGRYAQRLGIAFVQAVATGFRVTDPGSGPARRGLYHWEPAEDFHPLPTPDPVKVPL